MMKRTTGRVRVLIAAAVTLGVLAFGASTAWASSRTARTCSTNYPGNGVCVDEQTCFNDCFLINRGGGYCNSGCCICEY